MTKPVPDHAGVIASLLEQLVSTFADGPDHDDNVAKALAMFDALQPANLIDAMKTASAIASHFTAMNCFALARIPGISENTAKGLPRTAIGLGGIMDELLRERRKRGQPADIDPEARLARRADFLAMQASPVRHRLLRRKGLASRFDIETGPALTSLGLDSRPTEHPPCPPPPGSDYARMAGVGFTRGEGWRW